MNKELIFDEEDFKNFCEEYRAGKDIEGIPSEYPCIIVYKEYIGYYDYEFIYLTDFEI
jgi:hypothetical protein